MPQYKPLHLQVVHDVHVDLHLNKQQQLHSPLPLLFASLEQQFHHGSQLKLLKMPFQFSLFLDVYHFNHAMNHPLMIRNFY